MSTSTVPGTKSPAKSSSRVSCFIARIAAKLHRTSNTAIVQVRSFTLLCYKHRNLGLSYPTFRILLARWDMDGLVSGVKKLVLSCATTKTYSVEGLRSQ